MIRNNKQIWRIAEWLWNNCYHPNLEYESWKTEEQRNKDAWYDKALELQRKMINSEFVGGDNHEN